MTLVVRLPEVMEAEPLHDFAVAVVGQAILGEVHTRSDRSRANIVLDHRLRDITSFRASSHL